MMTAMEKHHFEEALQISDSAKQIYEELWKNEDYIKYVTSWKGCISEVSVFFLYFNIS